MARNKSGAGDSASVIGRLGLPPQALRYLEALAPADRAVLAEMVLQAEERQRRRVERAIEEVVHHVPAVLRGAVRRFLMG